MIRKPGILAKNLGLVFNHPQIFALALTHRSIGSNNNERLEYLGDSILGFVIADKLYEMFPEADEGDLSRLRSNLVNQTSLAELAREHNIGDYLILGSGELKSGGYRRDSILSDALEAIMGALLQDQGIEASKNWILSIFVNKLARLDLSSYKKDPKTELQELMQSKKVELPHYELIKMTGSAHSQTFNIQCTTLIMSESTTGSGVSRKKAEQGSAEKMLELIKAKK
ncbi:MAG: ribonuclease III [Methylococcales symbiont of Hymedesmia sp. n. MRB-2018]|nr:MAG: ribonuclease III [Methylococcales symbiont of Hymedesmia sp. n. MRB-2018]KAF3983242.1 MAG: ribonuclease III [Methylococcales symbiont of Hymedesmia sp. n. MRB-2018]